MRSDWLCKTVHIAPGHRILIGEFVNKVKVMIQPKATITSGKRKFKPTTEIATVSKKQKISECSNAPTHSCSSIEDLPSLADISSKIRRQISKWQNTQTSYDLRQLKEHEQFEVRVSRNEKPNSPAVVNITCNVCDKHIPLSMGNKFGDYFISNWSRHIKTCILQKQKSGKSKTQPTLAKYISSSLLESHKPITTLANSKPIKAKDKRQSTELSEETSSIVVPKSIIKATVCDEGSSSDLKPPLLPTTESEVLQVSSVLHNSAHTCIDDTTLPSNSDDQGF